MAIDQVLKMLIAHHNLVTYWFKPEIQQKIGDQNRRKSFEPKNI